VGAVVAGGVGAACGAGAGVREIFAGQISRVPLAEVLAGVVEGAPGIGLDLDDGEGDEAVAADR